MQAHPAPSLRQLLRNYPFCGLNIGIAMIFVTLAGEANAQEVLREINVSSTRVKDPLIESESLKWTPRPSTDAADFLRQKPEFSSAKIGGTAGTIFLRGLGGPRLGIVMNDSLEASGANHGTDPATSYIQPDAHDHITIVKGPNSVLYGSSMGGLVIFNENPRKFDKPGVQGRLVGGLGSFGRRDLTADVTAGTPLMQLRGVVNFTRGDNYKDGSGREFFSFFKRESGRLIATFTPTKNVSAEFSAEQGDAQVAFPAFSLMGDGIQFKREILASRFVVKDITSRFKKLEIQFYDRNLDHLMDNFTLRPLVNSSTVPGLDLFNRRTLMQKYRGRSARAAASFELTPTTEGIIGYEHKDEKFGGNNQTDNITCVAGACFPPEHNANPFYDLRTINNSVFTELTHFVDDTTTIKAGLRRDHFHTLSGELRDFLGTTIFPTSNSQRDDIANSGFIRVEKEFVPGAVGFVSLANGERPASNLERASFNGFNLKKEKNREINLGLTVTRSAWQGSVTVFGSRINDYILINQGTRSENIDADRVGTEFDVIAQITPNWKLFGRVDPGRESYWPRPWVCSTGANTASGWPLRRDIPAGNLFRHVGRKVGHEANAHRSRLRQFSRDRQSRSHAGIYHRQYGYVLEAGQTGPTEHGHRQYVRPDLLRASQPENRGCAARIR
jgi:iron complex outermembrane receptor protein